MITFAIRSQDKKLKIRVMIAYVLKSEVKKLKIRVKYNLGWKEFLIRYYQTSDYYGHFL